MLSGSSVHDLSIGLVTGPPRLRTASMVRWRSARGSPWRSSASVNVLPADLGTPSTGGLETVFEDIADGIGVAPDQVGADIDVVVLDLFELPRCSRCAPPSRQG